MPAPTRTAQEYLNTKAGLVQQSSKQQALNVLAGTAGLTEQQAANTYAGTTNLSIAGAINVKVGTAGLSLQEAAARL